MIGLLNNVREFVRIKKREARYKKAFAKQNATYDRFVISYLKSGRTWHRVMLGFYLARMNGVAESEAMKLEKLCQRAGLPSIKYTHNGTNPSTRLNASSPALASPDLWRSREVLLLVREPKALLVSSFHHARFRSHYFDGTLQDFIRDPRFGVEKIAAAYQRWHANRHQASVFTVISYEQMHARPNDALRRTLAFVGVHAPDESLIAAAVNFARFENMKQHENADFFNNAGMRTAGLINPEAGRRVREGKTDAYKSHLTDDDIAFIDRRLAELGGNPFAAETAVVAA